MKLSRVLERRSVLKGRVLDIGVERVELPDGCHADLEVLRHPGASAVLARTEAGELLLIRQYRHAAEGYLWEIPAGTREPGEDPLACAKRELEEETGFSASEWVALGEMLPAPGYTTERIYLFLASGLCRSEQKLDEDELISEVRQVPVAEVKAWARDGSIDDAKTIAALYRASERGLLGA